MILCLLSYTAVLGFYVLLIAHLPCLKHSLLFSCFNHHLSSKSSQKYISSSCPSPKIYNWKSPPEYPISTSNLRASKLKVVLLLSSLTAVPLDSMTTICVMIWKRKFVNHWPNNISSQYFSDLSLFSQKPLYLLFSSLGPYPSTGLQLWSTLYLSLFILSFIKSTRSSIWNRWQSSFLFNVVNDFLLVHW